MLSAETVRFALPASTTVIVCVGKKKFTLVILMSRFKRSTTDLCSWGTHYLQSRKMSVEFKENYRKGPHGVRSPFGEVLFGLDGLAWSNGDLAHTYETDCNWCYVLDMVVAGQAGAAG